MDTWTTNEVSRITGATPRQLQVWDERGLVRPKRIPGRSRTGAARNYSADDLRIVFVIAALRAKGVGLSKVRLVLNRLRGKILERYPLKEKSYLLTDPSGADCFVEVESNARATCLVMARATVPWLLVELEDLSVKKRR